MFLAIAESWQRGPTLTTPTAEAEDVDAAIRPLLAAARPRTTMADIN